MPARDPRSRILDLLAKGLLDEALSEMEASESAARRLGTDALVPLARSLLEAGRARESLRVLERASAAAAFGGDPELMRTQIGLPAGSNPRAAPAAPDTDALRGADVTNPSDENTTDRVQLPESFVASDTQPEALLPRTTIPDGMLLDHGQTPREGPPPFMDAATTVATSTPEHAAREADLDEPPSEAPDRARRPRRLSLEVTSRMDLAPIDTVPEAAAPAEPPSAPEAMLEEARAEIRLLRAQALEVTNRLSLPDIEIVGTFVAGSARTAGREAPAVAAPEVGPSAAATSVVGPEPPAASARVAPPRPPAAGPVPPPWIETTARVDLLRDAPVRRPRGLVRWGRVTLLALVVSVGLAAIAGDWALRARQADAETLERVRRLQASDTFADHGHALAVLSSWSGRFGGGQACAERAVEEAQMWGRFGQGEAHRLAAARALESCPGERDGEAATYARALLELYSGKAPASHELARADLVRHPRSARLRTVYAQLLEAEGQRDRAVQELTSARMLDPTFLPATLELARIQRRAGRRGEALVQLSAIEARSPRHLEARVERMMLELDTLGPNIRGPVPAAVSELDSALEMEVQGQPDRLKSQVALARGRFALARGKIDAASVLLGQAWRLGATGPEAALSVSAVFRLSGELASALEVSEAVPGGGAAMLTERARVLLAVGRPAPALRVLDEFARTAPASPAAVASTAILTARARLQLDDAPAAAAVLEASLGRGADAEAQLTRADALLAQGLWREARSVLAKVSTPPWQTCASAALRELDGDPRQAWELLDTVDGARVSCVARLRSRLAARRGDSISEISSLLSLLRIDPLAEDRIALVEAAWREHGVLSALAELRAVVRAPPTGPTPLLALADLLAAMRADREMDEVLRGARAAGAEAADLATTRARFERLRGRPHEALRALEAAAGGPGRPPAQRLELAAALLDVDRGPEAAAELERLSAVTGSRLWRESVKLRTKMLARSSGFAAADRALQGALQECGDAGQHAQDLLLWRVELGLDAGLPPTALQSLLRAVPAYPVTPETHYLAGRVAELAGNPEAARRAFALALGVDQAHVRSLERLAELEPGRHHRQRLAELFVPGGPASR